MAAIETRPVGARHSLAEHLVGGVLGFGPILLLWGQALLAGWLRVQAMRYALGPWALWGSFGLLVGLGILVVVIVLIAPRLPMLPTVAAVVLVYGTLADPLSPLRALPTLGP